VDDAAKRRQIKTRGDAGGGRGGWRAGPRARHRDEDGATDFAAPSEPKVVEVLVPETISVADLAHKMAVKAAEVIKVMMKMGSMVTINQVIDQETAMIVVAEMGHIGKPAKLDDPESFLVEAQDEGDRVQRPPVVTVMGHVDHGKTSLLDAIRKARVAVGEAAASRSTSAPTTWKPRAASSRSSTRRATRPSRRCARAAARSPDIVVLVVAADDSVMPQTIEAITTPRRPRCRWSWR
jgi:translation initiation factor IF-2